MNIKKRPHYAIAAPYNEVDAANEVLHVIFTCWNCGYEQNIGVLRYGDINQNILKKVEHYGWKYMFDRNSPFENGLQVRICSDCVKELEDTGEFAEREVDEDVFPPVCPKYLEEDN